MTDTEKREPLLFVLFTTMTGSKYIQDFFDDLANFKNKMNNNYNVSVIQSTIFNLFNAISPFGHLLCIDKYGHYAIDKFLTLCYQFNFVDVLEKFLKNIIIDHFLLLIEHSYPCRIVQNMLNSHSNKLKIYVLTQLNLLFRPKQNSPQRQQQQQHQQHQQHHNPIYTKTLKNVNTAAVIVGASKCCSHEKTDKTTLGYVQHQPSHTKQLQIQVVPATQQSVATAASVNDDYQLLYNTMTHHIGNYIIQAMIETACELNMCDIVLYVFNFVSSNNGILSCDKFGCRVVQKCIVSPNVPHVPKQCLFANIFNSISYICNNEYGNYCVQKCIEYSDELVKDAFVEKILFGFDLHVKNYSNSQKYNGRYTLPRSLKSSFENYMLNVQNPTTIINFSKFGFGKYSSNVCDVAFRHATYNQQYRLINYLCNPNVSIKYNVLFGLVNHEYGNFVIKNAIKTLINYDQQDVKYSLLLNAMKQVLNSIFDFVSGYHCQNKFSYAHNIIKLINTHYNHPGIFAKVSNA